VSERASSPDEAVSERASSPDDAVSERASSPDDAVTGAPTPEERRALFRVVRGAPTDEELAALTVVVAALASTPPAVPPAPRSAWNDPANRVRRPLAIGPGAWRASALPH
jgi:hypothetical protein